MPRSVLLIDDSPAVARFVEARLEGEVKLHYASDGTSGIALARSLSPDIILLDVDMPVVDGFEVCRRLKREPSLASVPILLLTGAAATNERLAGLDLGIVDYIFKPIEPAELRARMRTAFRLKHLSDLLSQKARLDSVTGLWNFTYFEARLTAEIALANRSARPVAILTVSLDNFDSLSADRGPWLADEALTRVANALAPICRAEDVLCRSDDGAFAIICPSSTTAGTASLAQRACDKVASLPESKSGPLTLSCGVAGTDEHADATTSTLCRAASNAMAYARDMGGNRVVQADASHWPKMVVNPSSPPERRAVIQPPPTQAA